MDPHDHYIQEEVQYDIDHDLNSAPLGSGCNALFAGNDIDDTVFLAADRPDSPSLIWMDMIQDLTDLPSPGTYINTNSHPATDHHLHAVASNDHGFISRYTANLECLSPDRFATDLPLSPLWFYQSANSTPAAGATTGSSVLPQGTAKCSNNSAKKPHYTRPPATSGLHKASSEPNIRRSSNLGIRPVAAVHQLAPDADYADPQIRNTRNIFLDNHLSDDLSDSNSFTNLSCSFPGSSDHYLQGFDQSAALQLGLEDVLMLHGQSSGGGDSVLDHLSLSRSDNYMSRSYTALPAPRLQKRNAQAEPQEDSGLRLVHMLLACAEAVARDDHVVAEATLIQLQRLVSKTGNSMQRVAAYFTAALHARLTNTGGRSYAALVSSLHDPSTADEVLEAYQVLYQACPYIKFAHFTCNQAIYEAFEGEERVHIVDLDIMQGYQWPAFIQALAARPGGAPHLRITGVGMPLELVQETGRRLGELAELVHLPFEFHAVGEKLEDLRAHMLQRRVGEALAVNSITRLHRLFSQASYSKSLPNLLHMLWQQAPHVLTLVEQEASHNGPFFLSRFLEALHYYSAIFDSLDATLPQNSPERAKVEQLLFAQEIVNIVACEDLQRIERHEKLEKWRKIMEATGFKSIPLSANAINQSKILLGLYPCSGYMLTEDKGALQLGWQERLILGVSAWSC